MVDERVFVYVCERGRSRDAFARRRAMEASTAFIERSRGGFQVEIESGGPQDCEVRARDALKYRHPLREPYII